MQAINTLKSQEIPRHLLGYCEWYGQLHIVLNNLPADDVFKCIFMNEKFCISIQISLKFVLKGPIDNSQYLVQVMAWHRTGDKPLPEQMLSKLTDAYVRH